MGEVYRDPGQYPGWLRHVYRWFKASRLKATFLQPELRRLLRVSVRLGVTVDSDPPRTTTGQSHPVRDRRHGRRTSGADELVLTEAERRTSRLLRL